MSCWYSIHRSADKAYVSIRSEIGYGPPSAQDFIDDLGDAPHVELHLDSSGGCHPTSLEVYRTLKDRDTVCTIERAHSGGAIIALAAHKVAIVEDGSMMVHSPQTVVIGGPAELRTEADKMQDLAGPIIEIFAERTGKPVAEIKAWFGRDTYFSAHEALENRLVDEIVPSLAQPPPSISEARPVLLQKIDRAACPLGAEADFLLKMLRAHGPVNVPSKAKSKLFRELSVWFGTHIHEVP